jgi:DNA-binding XRE family transcriptional regulator
MKKSSESAAVAEILTETFQTEGEREKFERDVALLVAAAELVRAAETAREEAHLSKAEIARRLGISREAVAAFMNGPRGVPDLRTVAGIYDQLGLYLDVRIRRQPRRGKKHKPIEVALAA